MLWLLASVIWSTGQPTNSDPWIWEGIGRQSPPTNRSFNAAVWTGSELLLWGGQVVGVYTYLNTGYRYSPTTDSWQDLGSAGAPSGRSLHSVVWTGREMIVWGGQPTSGGPTPTASGARYDPVTDTWNPMTTVGAPAGRLSHTAVWTGREMIVWGGGNYDRNFQDGGCYDPTTDSWKPLSTLGAPTARSSHGAVWTGQAMIVWGGNFLVCHDYSCRFKYPASLGRYNPSTDSWVTQTISNAPALRADFSAVWTGGEMIVWGGYNGSTYGNRTVLQTGGRFNPGTGTWTPVSLLQAPAPRDQHAAFWTGTEMLIWGGFPTGNGGGRYNPTSDAWMPGTTNGAPDTFANQSTVWTGEAMLGFRLALFAYYLPGLYAKDGLPNDWQERYFGPNHPDGRPQVDPDGDGQDNELEYLAGTDPSSASSRLIFACAKVADRTNQFCISFAPFCDGRTYTLLESSNLRNWRVTPTIGTSVTNASGLARSIPITNAAATAFYRLKISMP